MKTSILVIVACISLSATPLLKAQCPCVSITLKGEWRGLLLGGAGPMAVSGQYAFVSVTEEDDEGGLQVVDFTNPNDPQAVGWCWTSWSPLGVALAGQYAYLAVRGRGLVVLDITNPSRLEKVGECSQIGHADEITTAGNYAYVVASGALVLIDITDPRSPREVGRFRSGVAYFEAVAVSGRYAYAVEMLDWDGSKYVGGGVQVIDVSDPTQPSGVSRLVPQGTAQGVAVSGAYLYVSESTRAENAQQIGAGLEVFSVTDPLHPQALGRYDTSGGYCYKVALDGNYAYLANSGRVEASGYAGGALLVLDVSNPTQPQLVGAEETRGYSGVAVSGKYAYATGRGLHAIDISVPTRPRHVGSILRGSLTAVALSGDHAYVTADEAGLQVIDVHDPIQPHRVGGCGTGLTPADWSAATDVVLSGTHAYVADQGSGLEVIDIAVPVAPKAVGNCPITGNAMSIALAGDYAWVAFCTNISWTNVSGGVTVVDTRDPTHPQRVHSWISDVQPLRIAVREPYAYVATYWGGSQPVGGGLHVIDFSVPALPTRAGELFPDQNVSDVVIFGQHAFVAVWPKGQATGGFQVLDIAAPGTPQRLSEDAGSWMAERVAVAANRAYVVGDERLRVIDITEPAAPRWLGECALDDDIAGLAVEANRVYAAGENFLQIYEITELPGFVGQHLAGGLFHLSWNAAAAGMRVQQSTNLAVPVWRDLPGTELTNRISVPVSRGEAYFRLRK